VGKEGKRCVYGWVAKPEGGCAAVQQTAADPAPIRAQQAHAQMCFSEGHIVALHDGFQRRPRESLGHIAYRNRIDIAGSSR